MKANNSIPDFTPKEWELMQDYIKNSSKTPRMNLIKLINNVDPNTAALGMNSGPYFALDRLMNDEQIDLACHLKLREPTYIDELARRAGKTVEETAQLCEQLGRIGLIDFMPDEQGVDRVVLPIFVVGIMEQLIMDEGQSRLEKYPEIGVAFHKHTEFMMEQGHFMPASNLGVHRAVPVDKAIMAESRRATWEELQTLVKESANGSFAVCQCICRHQAIEYDEMGDETALDWCMPIGWYADSLVREGKAKYITEEQFWKRLKEAEDLGYVHNVSNHDGASPINYVCNCDYQTCMSLRASILTNIAGINASNFEASVDPDKCVACGQCVEKCPMNAVRLGERLPQKDVRHYPEFTSPAAGNMLSWSKEKWNKNWQYNRENVWHETGTAPCKTKCPAHVSVQGYLRMAAQGRYDEALEFIKKNNPLPAVCGNICNKRCEASCTRGEFDDPVAIDEVKKFLAYREIESEHRFVPKKIYPEGKKLAVIGAGPAGLSCAYYLAERGHEVTVFDKNAEAGGMLRYGIPSFRLEKDVLDAEIDVLRQLGVQFKCGVEVGKDVSLDALRAEGYKAFFLAIGAQKSSKMRILGEELEGVYGGVDFLREVNEGKAPAIGKRVAVVGGGNVAIDVVRTAVRLGAEEAYIIYRRSEAQMPADKQEVAEAIDEGVQFKFLSAPTEILGENGRVRALRVELMELGAPDEKGRRKPVGTGKLEEIAVDSVIGAIGQKSDFGALELGKLSKTEKGLVKADKLTYQTAQPDIFAGGDILTGPKFAIDAIAAGREAAISMHRYAWGNNLEVCRDRRDYEEIDKNNIGSVSYDTASRSKPAIDVSKLKTMHDERKVLTAEQVKTETARCLRCGAAHVDRNLCIGCGVCTTRCKFDAISLRKVRNELPVPNEEFMPTIRKELYRRRDNICKGPMKLAKPVITAVINKGTAKPKDFTGKVEPRKW